MDPDTNDDEQASKESECRPTRQDELIYFKVLPAYVVSSFELKFVETNEISVFDYISHLRDLTRKPLTPPPQTA